MPDRPPLPLLSRTHALVRDLRALADRPDTAGGRLLLDGVHLLQEARRARLRLELVVVSSSEVERDTEAGRLARSLADEGCAVYAASGRVLDAVSPVRTPSGIVALVRHRLSEVSAICGQPEAFVVAAADVQDPGNLGAIIRAAEAAGATGLLVCGVSANPFSWKTLRGSMGSALRLPIAGGLDTGAALDLMQGAGIRVAAAVPRDGQDPDAIDWQGRVGLLVGGEGPGLSDVLAARCDARVTIPMAPPVESLNVAVAAALVCYAARRQRVGS